MKKMGMEFLLGKDIENKNCSSRQGIKRIGDIERIGDRIMTIIKWSTYTY